MTDNWMKAALASGFSPGFSLGGTFENALVHTAETQCRI